MEIIIRRATEEDIKRMSDKPIWACDVCDDADWFYDYEVQCWISKGEAKVVYDGGSVDVRDGDYCVFPKGLRCVWHVTKPIQKYCELIMDDL